MAKKTESKAAIIRRLYAELGGGAEAVKKVAAEVGCRREYVRIVARQRIYAGKSPADIKYEKQPGVLDKIYDRKKRRWKVRYHGDDTFRLKHNARQRAQYHKKVAERRESA